MGLSESEVDSMYEVIMVCYMFTIPKYFFQCYDLEKYIFCVENMSKITFNHFYVSYGVGAERRGIKGVNIRRDKKAWAYGVR